MNESKPAMRNDPNDGREPSLISESKMRTNPFVSNELVVLRNPPIPMSYQNILNHTDATNHGGEQRPTLFE